MIFEKCWLFCLQLMICLSTTLPTVAPPRLTSLPLEKRVPAEDEEDSRMALAFLTVTGLILYNSDHLFFT